MGRKPKKSEAIRTCIADSLCCTIEINTTLLSNYTPIKIFKKEGTGLKCAEVEVYYFFSQTESTKE